MSRLGLCFVFLWASLTSYGQQPDVRIRNTFHTDSVHIGQRFHYSLTAQYPSQLTILFPDSTMKMGEYMFHGKEYFPTETKDSVSYDSVVYELSTYGIEVQQTLSLPVFVVNEKDCTSVFPKPDTIHLLSLIKDEPDTFSLYSLPIKSQTKFYPIQSDWNIIKISAIVGVVAGMIVGLLAWFWSPIRRHYRIRQLQRDYQKFASQYNSILKELISNQSSKTAENTLAMWKNYLEKLEKLPYSKLTTKETIALVHDESLISNLKLIDRSIYGGKHIEEAPFHQLQTFAELKYNKKLAEIKNE